MAHEYGCLMAKLPEQLSKEIIAWTAKNIPKEHLGPGGYELNPHITIKYGFKDSSLETIVRLKLLLEKHGPITDVGLLGPSLFKGNKDGDVLKIDVDSPTLEDLNYYITQNFDCFDKYPDYLPHITLAYLLPERAEHYASLNPPFARREFDVDKAEWSGTDGNKRIIYLNPILGFPMTMTKSLSAFNALSGGVLVGYQNRKKNIKTLRGKYKRKLYGGLADEKPDDVFDPEQLAAGVKVEMEHTNDPAVAREIAKDHLTEDPQYYQKLRKMESKSKGWITIGGGPCDDGDGQHCGGTAVFIDGSGTITKGPKKLTGSKIGESKIKKDKPKPKPPKVDEQQLSEIKPKESSKQDEPKEQQKPADVKPKKQSAESLENDYKEAKTKLIKLSTLASEKIDSDPKAWNTPEMIEIDKELTSLGKKVNALEKEMKNSGIPIPKVTPNLPAKDPKKEQSNLEKKTKQEIAEKIKYLTNLKNHKTKQAAQLEDDLTSLKLEKNELVKEYEKEMVSDVSHESAAKIDELTNKIKKVEHQIKITSQEMFELDDDVEEIDNKIDRLNSKSEEIDYVPSKPTDTEKASGSSTAVTDINPDTDKPSNEWVKNNPHVASLVKSGAASRGIPNKMLPDSTRPPIMDKKTAEYLNNYSWGYDGAMNKALRDTGEPPPGMFGGEDYGKPNKNGPEMFEHLQSAFSRVGKIGPPPLEVHRGLDIDDDIADEIGNAALEAFNSGNVFNMPGFTSTSTDKSVAKGFGVKVLFKINASQGLDMKAYSHFAEENELLLNHNTAFRVTRAEKNQKGNWEIDMDQILPNKI